MSHEKKDSALQKMQLILLSAAIMIVLAQLNINLIINGFKISLAVICLPLFAFLFEHFPVFPVTLITAPGCLLFMCDFSRSGIFVWNSSCRFWELT